MANLNLLANALSFIEDHLCDEIKTEDIAQTCCVSKSSLEKTFRFTTHFSVYDYITRRRMNNAAKLLIEKPELSILDVAVEYGYSSHEAFTRAFCKVWKCNPMEYRKLKYKRLRPFDFFPQITGVMQLEGENFMRRTLDISELYDFIKERKDCYFVCCDIHHMIEINEVSREAGDIAIIEAMKRMEDSSSEHDVVFRIGGDEFVILTNSKDKNYADDICRKILSMNGKLLPYDKTEVPLKLYASSIKLSDNKTIRYNEIFQELQVTCRTKQEQQ